MKIKRKVQKNLPQLIEYAWDNGIKNKGFESERTSRAYFDYDGYLSCTRAMEPSDSFTVEVEEEITEDTEISMLAHYSVFGFKTTKSNASINEEKGGNSIAFYIMNDDKTMTLIWRYGKLVD